MPIPFTKLHYFEFYTTYVIHQIWVYSLHIHHHWFFEITTMLIGREISQTSLLAVVHCLVILWFHKRVRSRHMQLRFLRIKIFMSRHNTLKLTVTLCTIIFKKHSKYRYIRPIYCQIYQFLNSPDMIWWKKKQRVNIWNQYISANVSASYIPPRYRLIWSKI